ncbi:MAG: hypothetical protein Tsb0014_28780 [Pleurocapsa sp.]
MNNIQYKRATGLYYSREEAEAAVRDLKSAGYDMNQVSVIARDNDNLAGQDTTKEIGNKADDGAAAGALTGGALGGITGLLVGLGALAIPGIGPILLAGAEATAIATTIAGAGIGAAAGGLVGALIGLGIPEEKAKIYSDRVGRGSFLVMVTGTAAGIKPVEAIMRRHGVEEFDIYNTNAPATAKTTKPVSPARTAKATTAKPASSIETNNAEQIKLYEERLVVDKEREKAGEVAIGKRVETETASVSVPVERERIVVERRNAVDGTVVNPSQVDFNGGEVARMEAYEETADIEKQAFVREEVNVRKEVEQDTVKARENIRREELKVETDGDVIQR